MATQTLAPSPQPSENDFYENARHSMDEIFMSSPGNSEPLQFLLKQDLIPPTMDDTSRDVDPVDPPPIQAQSISTALPPHTQQQNTVNLPTFSFNPGASHGTDRHEPMTPVSPTSQGPPPSPSKGKHRRVNSGFVGSDSKHQSPVASANANVDKITEELSKQSNGSLTPSKGHRHRRSRAMSSKDFGAIQRPGSSDTNFEPSSASGPSTPTFGSCMLKEDKEAQKCPSTDDRFSQPPEIYSRRSLPLLKLPDRPSISRPIHSSDGAKCVPCIAPSQYLENIRSTAIPASRTGFPQSDPLLTENISSSRSEESLTSDNDYPGVSIVERANDGIPWNTENNSFLLDENFDSDPTDAIVTGGESRSQPSSPTSVIHDLDNALGSEVIDLDEANDVKETAPLTIQDLRTLRAKSFSAARKSMHSGTKDVSSSGLYRRAETFPSLSLPVFERPQDTPNGSQTTSRFEIENVFEEDEEDEFQTRAMRDRESNEESYSPNLEEVGLGLTLRSRPSTGVRSLGSEEESPSTTVYGLGSKYPNGHETPAPAGVLDYRRISGADLGENASGPVSVHSETGNASDEDVGAAAVAPTDSRPNNEVFRRGSRPGWWRTNSASPWDPSCNDETMQAQLFEAWQEEQSIVTGHSERPSSAEGFIDQRPATEPLVPREQQQSSSFATTPQEPSKSSTWSSPQLATEATSLQDAYPSTQRSNTDGNNASGHDFVPSIVPSLINSLSTASATRPGPSSSGTTAASTPADIPTRHNTLRGSTQREQRHKRSSIRSLSQLLGYGGHDKSDLSINPSSLDLSGVGESRETPAKQSRRKRVSRVLKFWKPKDD